MSCFYSVDSEERVKRKVAFYNNKRSGGGKLQMGKNESYKEKFNNECVCSRLLSHRGCNCVCVLMY